MAPLALSACGGGGGTPAEEFEPVPFYEIPELPTYTLDDLIAVAAGELELDLEQDYALSVDLADIELLETLNAPEALAPARLEASGSLTVPASDDDVPTLSGNIHLLGATVDIEAAEGFDLARLNVESESEEGDLIILREGTDISIEAAEALAVVRLGAQLDVIQSSTITLISRDLDIPDEFPAGAMLVVGGPETAGVTLLGEDTAINLEGHRAQVRIGAHEADTPASLIVAAGAEVNLTALDFGPEITTPPTARIEVGREVDTSNPTPAEGYMLINGDGSAVSVTGSLAEVYVGNNALSSGQLVVRNGGSLFVTGDASGGGQGVSRLFAGNQWDEMGAGYGSITIQNEGTQVFVTGHQANLILGYNESEGMLSVSDGAILRVEATYDARSSDTYSAARFGVGIDGGSGALEVTGSGTVLEITGVEAQLMIARDTSARAETVSSGIVEIREGAFVALEGRFDAEAEPGFGSYAWVEVGRLNNGGDALLLVDGAGTELLITASSAYIGAGQYGSSGDIVVSGGASINLVTSGEEVSGAALDFAGLAALGLGSAADQTELESTLVVTGAESAMTLEGEAATAEIYATGTLSVLENGLFLLADADDAATSTVLSAGVEVSGEDAILRLDGGTVESTILRAGEGATLAGEGLLEGATAAGIALEMETGAILRVGDGVAGENLNSFGELAQGSGTLTVDGSAQFDGAILQFEANTDGQDELIVSGRVDLLAGSTIRIETDLTETFTLIELEEAIELDDGVQVFINGTEYDLATALSVQAVGELYVLEVNAGVIA